MLTFLTGVVFGPIVIGFAVLWSLFVIQLTYWGLFSVVGKLGKGVFNFFAV